MTVPAILALEDGSIFRGVAIGATGHSVGEVVFNTAMTGYQEILTDPSYARQIITLTYPHIGNTGTNSEDEEAADIWSAGLVIRDLPLLASSFRNEQSLQDYLVARNVIGIADIDTRRLTRILRDKGAQNGCIMAGDIDEEAAMRYAKGFDGLKGMDLAKVVSTTSEYTWQQGSWDLEREQSYREYSDNDCDYHVVAYDFGVKRNILRMLVDRGCRLTVVPAQTPAADVLAMNPDGVFLSNGPGHHGANHPVQNLEDGTVLITSQNHGFAADESTLPDNLRVTHKSLFDGSLQGIHRTDKAAFSFQGHPEASPGPHDAAPLFDHFIELMQQRLN